MREACGRHDTSARHPIAFKRHAALPPATPPPARSRGTGPRGRVPGPAEGAAQLPARLASSQRTSIPSGLPGHVPLAASAVVPAGTAAAVSIAAAGAWPAVPCAPIFRPGCPTQLPAGSRIIAAAFPRRSPSRQGKARRILCPGIPPISVRKVGLRRVQGGAGPRSTPVLGAGNVCPMAAAGVGEHDGAGKSTRVGDGVGSIVRGSPRGVPAVHPGAAPSGKG